MKQFDQWKPGKVVSIDKQFGGRLEVRLDESDLPANFPKGCGNTLARRTLILQVSAASQLARPAPEGCPGEQLTRYGSGRTAPTNSISSGGSSRGIDGDNVKLIKADGKHIEVPLAKLSDNDATYAREQAKKVEENPFKEAPGER